MSLRELAESQLKAKQEADEAEAEARQIAYATEATRLCREWFHSVLKTEPDVVVCTTPYDGYNPNHGCRALVEDEWFQWSDDALEFSKDYLSRGSSHRTTPATPGVRVVDEPPEDSNRWVAVVGTHDYVRPLYAWDLPSLALHLQAVDKVRAKRKQLRK